MACFGIELDFHKAYKSEEFIPPLNQTPVRLRYYRYWSMCLAWKAVICQCIQGWWETTGEWLPVGPLMQRFPTNAHLETGSIWNDVSSSGAQKQKPGGKEEKKSPEINKVHKKQVIDVKESLHIVMVTKSCFCHHSKWHNNQDKMLPSAALFPV